jgi:hypothetical protein
MRITAWLVGTDKRRLTALWSHVSQPFAEATVTKLRCTSEKFDGVVGAEGRKARLHCPIVLIAER